MEKIQQPPSIPNPHHEFHRLLLWIKNHPNDWQNLCDPVNQDLGENYIIRLIQELYHEGLYSLAFYLAYASRFRPGIDRAAIQTVYECLMDLTPEELMERFCGNLGVGASECSR